MAVSRFLLACFATGVGVSHSFAADVLFSRGAYVIDMGVVPQTAATGLKPFGFIYYLVNSNQASAYWAINPNKVTDKNPTNTVEGVDLYLNGKAYRGGPFIVASEDITPAVASLITTWRAKGVVIDGPITNSFTAPIYDIVTSFPHVVLDSQNGTELIKSFYTPAEVPASSYRLGSPTDLATCDDVYGMPHADPQYWSAATRAGLLNFILRGGCFWASCHAVSAMEASPPTYVGFNFLSANSLVPFGSHLEQNPTPLSYNTNDPSIWTEPLMQFLGKVDLALQGGSEVVYVPDSHGWGPQAKVAVFNKLYADSRQPWISHSNPSMAAADVVFGRAYNNTNYGLVMYVSSHSFQADGVAQNTAVGRLYGNMVLRTGIQRRPRVSLNVAITSLRVGEDTLVNAAITGNGGPYSILWGSSDGSFADPTSTNTIFTASPTAQIGPSTIQATVSDPCNSRTYDYVLLNLLPAAGPAIYKTASWTNSPGPAQGGDQINYQIKLDNLTNLTMLTGARITDSLPPNTTYKAASANPPQSSGPNPLVWLLGTNTAEVLGSVGGTTSNTFSATTNTFDTYIDNGSAGNNFGGATNLTIGNSMGPGKGEKRALIRFDLSAIPSNATISSASLVLTKIGGTASAARTISVYRLTNDWTENTLNGTAGQANWNARKAGGGGNWKRAGGDFVARGDSTNNVATANGAYTWDVTAAIQSANTNATLATTNGFLLRYNISKLPNDTMIFASSENAAGNGPQLIVNYTASVGTSTRVTASPWRLVGSATNLPTITVSMTVTVTGNPTNLTVTPPANLTGTASAGATATKEGGYPSPASAIVPAGGGTVTFSYKYDVTSLGTNSGSLIFSGKPADAGGATYAIGAASSILTVPTLNYSVLVSTPLPPLVQDIPNTATFSDHGSFQVGTNEVTSTPATVPVNSSSPNIGIAKAVTSIVNLADGRYTVTFDMAVTNLGSVTISNVQVGDNLSAAFPGRLLSGVSVNTTPGLTVNPGFDGVSATNLLMGTNTLLAGAGGRVTLAVTVAAGSTLNYTNQARASATDLSGTVATSDLSDNGTNPDPNGDGDPTEAGENDPTPVLFSENPSILVSKDLVSLVKNSDGTFTLSYAISVGNPGDVNLSGVQVSDKLATAFPSPATFAVNSLSSSQFTVNPGYNGNSSSNLLAASQTLGVGAQGLINLTITVNRNGGSTVNFTNQANSSATSPASQVVAGSASVLAVLEIPAVTVTKQVTGIAPNGTNFSVSMRIDVSNSGDVTLTNVQAADDLGSAFSGVQSFSITSNTASGLTINTNYDGLTDLNLLTGLNTLSMGATGSVFLTVKVTPGLGTTFGNMANASGTSTSAGGETVTAQSAEIPITPSLVQGTLFLDRNTNGVLDAGDVLLPYVDIKITTSSNTISTVTSDVLGHYVALVPPGTTIVDVNELDAQFPTNVTLTAGSTDPTAVSVPAGGIATVDKGYVLAAGKGVVNGYLFLDIDGDGLYDTTAGDAPIPNVDVQVVDKNNITNIVTTDSNGYFLKTVPSGQAIVRIVTTDTEFPAGVVLTIDDFDNGSDPTMVTVPDGGVVTDSTGYVTPDVGSGEVYGIAFIDRNTNGVFDVADSPLANVNVSITDTNGTVTLIPTDASGFYSLIVSPGLTIVNVLTNDPNFPAGSTVTIGTTNPSTVNVADGGSIRSDKGFKLPTGKGIVQGVLYIDSNNNGTYEAGVDVPIPNVTINITSTNGVVVPLLTDANGVYSLLVSNGITAVQVDTVDPNFPAGLTLTAGETNPTFALVPDGGSVTVNVGYTGVNRIPAPMDDSAYTKENVAVGGNVLSNDDPGDAPISSLTIVTNAAHGIAALNSDGSYTYTPNNGFYGADSFVYQLCDANGDCATATVNITVNSVPFANPDTASVNKNTLLTGSVATNDIPSADGGNIWSLVSGPAHGAANLNPDGSYTYQPNTNYVGGDSFTYKLCDADGDCSSGLVSITVLAVNQAPTATNDVAATAKNVALTIDPRVNDFDADGDPLTIIGAIPTNGTTVISGGTNIVFTPATNFVGTATIGYTISDGNGGTASALITISVTNTPPVAIGDSYTLGENTSLTISGPGVLGNDTDVDGDALTAVKIADPGHGTLTLNGNGGFTYTPAGNYFGADSFTYQANDGLTNSGTATVSLTITNINRAPVANTQNVTTPEDTATNLTLTALDLDGDALTYIIVAGPTNGTISNFVSTNGTLTFLPGTNYNGVDHFTFVADDGTTDSQPALVTITVTPVNDAPVANDQSVSTAEDTARAITLTATDVDGDTLTYSITVSPTNGVLSGFNSATGGVTYLPGTNYVGVDHFSFVANDGTTNSAAGVVTINVTPVNHAPVANNQSVTTAEDTAKVIVLTASDLDGDTLTYNIVTGPTNGTISGFNATTGTLTYLPGANYNGVDHFTFAASDGITGSQPALVTITITPVNDQPVANDQSVTTAEDTAKAITLAATDADGDTLTYSIATGPTNGTISGFNANTGALSYLPGTNYNGVDHFTFVANDGTTNSQPALVTITVTPVNDQPVANGQSVTTSEDTAKAITLTATDEDGDTLTYSIVTGPTNGTISGFNANTGALTYLPSTNYNGVDHFTFVANDGTTNSQPALVTITITPVNDQPVANDQSVTTAEDTAKAITLAATDADGDTLTYSIATGPTNGTISGFNANTGALSYLPGTNYNGVDHFAFVANDGTTNSQPALVTITITSVNDRPVANSQSVTTAEDTSKAITLAATDVDGDTLTYSIVTGPTNGTISGFNANTGALAYLPGTNYNGLDHFTFVANDGTTDSQPALVTITITPVNDQPVAGVQSVTTPEDTATNIVLIATDVDGDVLTYRIVTGPTNGTISGFNTNSGALAYLPSTNYNGTDHFTFVANDGTTNSQPALVAITITPVDDAPVAKNDSYALGKNKTLTVPAPGILSNDTDVEGDSLTAILVTNTVHGNLALNSNGGFTYTPSSNYFGADSFAYKANDGQSNSVAAIVTLTITNLNYPPVVTADNFTNYSNTPLTLPFTNLLVNDYDPDGDTISIKWVATNSVQNAKIVLTATNLTYYPPTNFTGTDSFNYAISDSAGASATGTVFVVVIPVPFLVSTSSIVFNPQSGLFEQTVGVTNNGSSTVAAFRLLVSGLRTNVTLYNAAGTENGLPYVQYNSPLNPGSGVKLALEFYIPDRRPITNTFIVEVVVPDVAGTNAASGVPITTRFMDNRQVPPRFVIEWASIPGRTYTVLYTDSLVSAWKAATPSITANATRTQWYDDGPPKTESAPLSVPLRLYRVVVAPAN